MLNFIKLFLKNNNSLMVVINEVVLFIFKVELFVRKMILRDIVIIFVLKKLFKVVNRNVFVKINIRVNILLGNMCIKSRINLRNIV